MNKLSSITVKGYFLRYYTEKIFLSLMTLKVEQFTLIRRKPQLC